VDNYESLIDEVDRELMEQDVNVLLSHVREDDYRLDSHIRHYIANKILKDYKNN